MHENYQGVEVKFPLPSLHPVFDRICTFQASTTRPQSDTPLDARISECRELLLRAKGSEGREFLTTRLWGRDAEEMVDFLDDVSMISKVSVRYS